MTESTDTSIRLNSSKQPHAPHEAKPLRILPIATKSIPSPQFVTIHRRPKALARSLVVSVLPVPAGPIVANVNIFQIFIVIRNIPAGAPPSCIDKA